MKVVIKFLCPRVKLNLNVLLKVTLKELILAGVPIGAPLTRETRRGDTVVLVLTFLVLFVGR